MFSWLPCHNCWISCKYISFFTFRKRELGKRINFPVPLICGRRPRGYCPGGRRGRNGTAACRRRRRWRSPRRWGACALRGRRPCFRSSICDRCLWAWQARTPNFQPRIPVLFQSCPPGLIPDNFILSCIIVIKNTKVVMLIKAIYYRGIIN